MMSLLGLLGWSGIVKWLVPWVPGFGPRTSLALTLALALGVYTLWIYREGTTGKQAAVAAATKARDDEWQKEIAKANATNEQRIKEALDAARQANSSPLGRDQLIGLCSKSPECRSALAKRR